MAILHTNIFGLYVIMINTTNLTEKIIKAFLHYIFILWPIFLLAYLLHLIASKTLRTILKTCCLIVSGVICICDWFSMYQYHGIIDQYKLGIIIGTDPSTAKEFFSAYVLQTNVMLTLALAVVLIYFVVKNFRAKTFSKKAIKIISIGLIFSLAGWAAVAFKNRDNLKEKFIYGHMPLVRLAMDFKSVQEQFGSEEIFFAVMDEMKANAKISQGKMQVPYVVFILGESTTRTHMNAYGYSLPTTPFLNERIKKNEVALFDDTIACANWTSLAMSMIFTGLEKNNNKTKWYEHMNLIDILNLADYETIWISNQEPVGVNGNFDRNFAARSDKSKFLRISGGSAGNIIPSLHDGEILPVLDDFLQKSKASKQFYLLHLYGAHTAFHNRYPKNFEKFLPNDEPGKSNEEKKLRAEYDNAVLYGDYVVDEIYKRFENKNAIVFFLSDHGMDLFETGNIASHTFDAKRSRLMIEIPFIIWTSQAFQKKYPEVWQRIKKSVHRPYRTDYFLHTLLDAIDIKHDAYQEKFSVINAKFKPFKRIYGGQLYQKQRKKS